MRGQCLALVFVCKVSLLLIPWASSGATEDSPTDKPKCEERALWAIEQGKKPIYNNKIFAKAFPYYVRFEGGTDKNEQIAALVDQALTNALRQWGSSLLGIRMQLDTPLREYVESMLLCKGGDCVYSSPPVVRMKCPENAAMLIVVYNGDRFPAQQRWVAGMAKVEGRTILLNSTDFTMTYDQLLFSTWSNKKPTPELNMTAVLAHELGHSFGLAHSAVAGSIMMADFSRGNVQRVVKPSDGRMFAEILKKHVDGGAPGHFDLKECQGLLVGKPPRAQDESMPK